MSVYELLLECVLLVNAPCVLCGVFINKLLSVFYPECTACRAASDRLLELLPEEEPVPRGHPAALY